MIKNILTLILLLISIVLVAQEVPKAILVGYVYESNNRGYLNEVKVIVTSDNNKDQFEIFTDKQGKFELIVPIIDNNYTVQAEKSGLKKVSIQVSTKGKEHHEGVFAKIEMSRLPGYILEMSLMDFVDMNDPAALAYSIDGAKIEVYNNTLQQEILNIPAHPSHIIQCLLEQGNEYIFLIRKEGYYTKRMRANVNVNGCILCMEGFGTVTPSVVENLTKENTMGILATNIMLKKMVLNEVMKMDNIYYDLGKSTLRPEAFLPLDDLAKMMFDNPQLVVELSSHTDSRGSEKTNLELSQRRAASVVEYIKARVPNLGTRMEAKGYGESRPLNSCVDGVECSEELYQQNRRTELSVIDILVEDPGTVRSLASMMQERNFDLILDANSQAYADDVARKEVYHRAEASIPQSMTMSYAGYKIQLLEKEGDLSTNHFIFYEYDQVFVDVLKQNLYAFLIGDFKNYETAVQELKKYQQQYPKAQIVEYNNGLRVRK